MRSSGFCISKMSRIIQNTCGLQINLHHGTGCRVFDFKIDKTKIILNYTNTQIERKGFHGLGMISPWSPSLGYLEMGIPPIFLFLTLVLKNLPYPAPPFYKRCPFCKSSPQVRFFSSLLVFQNQNFPALPLFKKEGGCKV